MEKSVNFGIGSRKTKKSSDDRIFVEGLAVKISGLEDQILEIKNQINSSEEGVFSISKKIKKEVEGVKQEILDLKHIIDDIKEEFNKLCEGINSSARKTDLETLYKYVKMWDPMSFVRREELERLLDEGELKKKDLKE